MRNATQTKTNSAQPITNLAAHHSFPGPNSPPPLGLPTRPAQAPAWPSSARPTPQACLRARPTRHRPRDAPARNARPPRASPLTSGARLSAPSSPPPLPAAQRPGAIPGRESRRTSVLVAHAKGAPPPYKYRPWPSAPHPQPPPHKP